MDGMWFLERCLIAKKREVGKLESWKFGELDVSQIRR